MPISHPKHDILLREIRKGDVFQRDRVIGLGGDHQIGTDLFGGRQQRVPIGKQGGRKAERVVGRAGGGEIGDDIFAKPVCRICRINEHIRAVATG